MNKCTPRRIRFIPILFAGFGRGMNRVGKTDLLPDVNAHIGHISAMHGDNCHIWPDLLCLFPKVVILILDLAKNPPKSAFGWDFSTIG
jgi:hypothetical protein